MYNMEISQLKDNEYYLNVTRLLIAKYHPQNKALCEEYDRLNKNLLNNLISHYKKCEYYKDIKRMILVKEIGDKEKIPHIHSIVVFEDMNKLIGFKKYIETRILKAYKDDSSIVSKNEIKYYIYYIFKTFKPTWVEYKDYFCGNNLEVLTQWRLLFKRFDVRDEIINKVTVFKNKVTQIIHEIRDEQTKKIINALIKDEIENDKEFRLKTGYMFIDD